MPRPQKSRRICCYPDYWSFAPDQDTANDTVVMSLDEFETIRLIDYQSKTQEQCAQEMNVARTTVTAIYDTARKKLAAALVEGRRIVISGGNYTLDNTISEEIARKGSSIMRIAVTYENGQIFQHFGRTEQFKLYDVADGKIINEQVVGTMGAGHGALAGFLKNAQADVLICGGIGGGAQMAMQEAGITLYGGNMGSADEAVQAFLAQTLVQNENPTCDHHDHEHGEGHSCGDHGCGSHSCGKTAVMVRDYPDNGRIYYDILFRYYFDNYIYTHEEIISVLELSRSNYYRYFEQAVECFYMHLIPVLKSENYDVDDDLVPVKYA